MNHFNFTRSFSANSSLVRGGWYTTEGNLLLSLDNNVYLYPEVPLDEVERLFNADSPGRYYNNTFRKKYRASSYLGRRGHLVLRPAASSPDRSVSLATPAEAPKTLRKTDVHFESNGRKGVHTVRTSDLNEVLSLMENLSNMLNVPIRVTEATVYFE